MSKTIKLCSIATAIMMTLSSAAGASSTGGGPSVSAANAVNKPADELLAPNSTVSSEAPARNDMFMNALNKWDVCITVDARWLASTTPSGVYDIIGVIIKDCRAELNNLKAVIGHMYPGSELEEKGIPEDTFIGEMLERSGGVIKEAISTERSKILDKR